MGLVEHYRKHCKNCAHFQTISIEEQSGFCDLYDNALRHSYDTCKKYVDTYERVLCKNCKFCHAYKRLLDQDWEYSSCCTVFQQTEKPEEACKYDCFVLEVNPDRDHCEMFDEREESNGIKRQN